MNLNFSYFRDDLLLEAGFLCLFVAPLLPGKRRGSKGTPSDYISFWLVKWLYFRLTFTTGLLKFIKTTKWWNLTGINLLTSNYLHIFLIKCYAFF